ncbi:BatA domain-containing protein [Luteimonas sp. MJ246]|uniref:BatA domain-containing protein n=1 Tax=Luteimonas sp. MJ174 TaxID=3129237 RepID=UPI0031BA2E20
MNPSLLLPAGLAALLALAVPLLLHLARRDEQQPVDFAALRWLSTRLRPRKRLRFEERLLLVLRLLLIVLLALLLARPVLPLAGGGAPWIVAAPGVGADALRDAVYSTADAAAADAGGDHGGDQDVASADIQRRWLAPGFPSLDEAPPPPDARTGISLLRELDMQMETGAALVVLVPPVLEGVDAERPRLSRRVEWRVLPDAGASPAGALEGASPASPAPRLIIEDAGTGDGARYLEAVAVAWRATHGGDDQDEPRNSSDQAGEDAADGTNGTNGNSGNSGNNGNNGDDTSAASDADTSVPTGLEVRAWLTQGALPPEAIAWIEAGGTALLAHDTLLPALEHATTAWVDEQGIPLLREATIGRGRTLQWTRALAPQALPVLLDADFPHRLRIALEPPPAPSRVLAAEHAPLLADVGPWPQALRELSPWLALAIALLFLFERWLAAGPRGERGA